MIFLCNWFFQIIQPKTLELYNIPRPLELAIWKRTGRGSLMSAYGPTTYDILVYTMTNRVSLKPQVWNLFFLKCSLFILLYVSMFKMTLRRFDKKWLLDNIIYFISLNQLHFYNHFNCHKYTIFSQWQKKWPWQKCFLPFNERLLKFK